MKNSFFNSFVPKQPNFFCLLKQLADILSEAADVLTESVEQGKPEGDILQTGERSRT